MILVRERLCKERIILALEFEGEVGSCRGKKMSYTNENEPRYEMLIEWVIQKEIK